MKDKRGRKGYRGGQKNSQGKERVASMYAKGQDYECGDSLVWSSVQ